MASSRRPADAAPGHAAGEDRAAQERTFKSAQPVHAAAAEARGFADRIEARNGLARAVEHAALQIRSDASETLAAHDERANGDERQRALVEDFLRLADPHAVAAVFPQFG